MFVGKWYFVAIMFYGFLWLFEKYLTIIIRRRKSSECWGLMCVCLLVLGLLLVYLICWGFCCFLFVLLYVYNCEMEVIICVDLGVFLSVLGCELFCGDCGICVMRK